VNLKYGPLDNPPGHFSFANVSSVSPASRRSADSLGIGGSRCGHRGYNGRGSDPSQGEGAPEIGKKANRLG
jgi:hypothetical protein